MRRIHPPLTYIKNRARGDWLVQGVRALVLADESDIGRAKEQFTEMLETLAIRPETVADSIGVGPIEISIPPELSEDAGNSATILRLILQRHRKAIGLSGEVSLSSAIDRLNRGVDLTNFDMARIRDARARARLAVTVPA
jgi:hypothetical protein